MHKLTANILLLKVSDSVETNKGETSTKLKSNISTIITNLLSKHTSVPNLVHTKDDTSNTTAETENTSVTHWVDSFVMEVQCLLQSRPS